MFTWADGTFQIEKTVLLIVRSNRWGGGFLWGSSTFHFSLIFFCWTWNLFFLIKISVELLPTHVALLIIPYKGSQGRSAFLTIYVGCGRFIKKTHKKNVYECIFYYTIYFGRTKWRNIQKWRFGQRVKKSKGSQVFQYSLNQMFQINSKLIPTSNTLVWINGVAKQISLSSLTLSGQWKKKEIISC